MVGFGENATPERYIAKHSEEQQPMFEVSRIKTDITNRSIFLIELNVYTMLAYVGTTPDVYQPGSLIYLA